MSRRSERGRRRFSCPRPRVARRRRGRRDRRDDRFLPRFVASTTASEVPSECSILSTVREKAIRLNNGSVVPLSWASFHERLTKLLWNAKKYAPRLDAVLSLSPPSRKRSFRFLYTFSFPASFSRLRSSWRSRALSRRSLGWLDEL